MRNAASRRPRWCCPRAPTPRSTKPRTCSASRCTRRRYGPTGRADVDAMAACGQRQHGAGGGLGAAVSAGRRRSHSGHRGTGERGRCELPRRCVHGRLRAAVRRDAGPAGAAVGFPRRRRALDFRRRAQARLRAERRLGDPAPHQGTAALSDVRVRRLARRLLRIAEPAGYPLRIADGGGVGGDAAPRRRRLRRVDARDARQRRPHSRRHRRDRRRPGTRQRPAST